MKIICKVLIRLCTVLPIALTAVIPPAHAREAPSETAPAGAGKTAKMKALETGARLLQDNTPLGGFDIYLVGFHPMKERPELQMESHHYCHQLNRDFAQCVLFDGNTAQSSMNGVEFIISEKLFESLPEQEKKFWHPHNGEILSGQLVAPGIPQAAEKILMKDKINSYGKTWHVWNTGHEGHPPDELPLGEPMLAWSFNRDGEAIPGMVEKRDRELNIDSARIRAERAGLQKFARPQFGVDALKGRFGRPTRDIPGVVAKEQDDKLSNRAERGVQ
jgi:hypothetical protein